MRRASPIPPPALAGFSGGRSGDRSGDRAAVLLAFSGFYALYHADGVFTDGVMDMFGAAMVFHGMAVFVQEGDSDSCSSKLAPRCFWDGGFTPFFCRSSPSDSAARRWRLSAWRLSAWRLSAWRFHRTNGRRRRADCRTAKSPSWKRGSGSQAATGFGTRRLSLGIRRGGIGLEWTIIAPDSFPVIPAKERRIMQAGAGVRKVADANGATKNATEIAMSACQRRLEAMRSFASSDMTASPGGSS